MSTTIQAGGVLVLDPNDERIINFDWDDVLSTGVEILSSTWTIAAIKQSGITALTADSGVILDGNRVTQSRFIATTATNGDQYWVSNQIETDESPAETIEQRFRVLVQEQ